MTEELVNKGVAIVGADAPASNTGKHPIVVVGTARGGTSMVAGCLHHLGVFMGDKAVPPVFEDVELAKLMEAGDWSAAQKIVNDYRTRCGAWGWKRPSSIDYLGSVQDVFGQPIFVFVFKDLMSIAQRNSISMLTDLIDGLESAHRQYGQMLSFIKACSPPSMLVSYEKAMAYPDYFLEQLVQFTGIKASRSQVEAAMAFIEPAPEKYLDASRITKAQGRLGGIAGGQVFGWARFIHQKSPAEVRVYINDKEVASGFADKPREDLHAKFGQDCAYTILLPKECVLKPGDRVRARVTGEVRDLENSPLQV